MYKRRTKSGNRSQTFMSSLSRGSDIKPPDNTSLLVNRSSGTGSTKDDEARSSVAALLSDDDIDIDRPSTSLMYSMSQKKHSTPQKSYNNNVFRDSNSQQTTSSKSSGSSFLAGKTRSTPTKIISNANLLPFLKILHECGVKEISEGGSFELSQDQILVSRQLNNVLSYADILETFVNSLADYMNDTENLKKLVIYTQTSNECDVARGPVQEPMLRLLLLVDCLQGKLLNLLLERMVSVIMDSPEGDDLPLISCILRQARCLNRIENTKFGCKLFELIELSSTDVKREIIFLLPELLVEDEVEYAASQLVELLTPGTELTPVIIGSLNCLQLTSTLKMQIRNKIILRLEKSPPAYLPSLTQFVVCNCDPSNMMQMISALREHLPFTPALWEKREAECSKNEKLRREVDSYIRLTFDGFKFAIMSSKPLAEAWFKVIQNITSPNDFRPVDLMILILLHGFVLDKKSSVAALIKNKITNGVLTEEHIQQTIKILRIVATEKYKEILDVAATLLQSFKEPVAEAGITLYMEAFKIFSGFLGRDLVCNIIPQIMTGNQSTVQNALNLLGRLRDTYKQELEGQAFALITLLTKLPDLSILQVRQLVDIVASLIASNTQDDTGLLDELHIFVMKKLSSWQSDTQQKGLVSAVMLLKHIMLSGVSSASNDVVVLLGMAQGTSQNAASRKGFFYDELATMLRDVDSRPKFITSLRDQLFNSLVGQIFVSDLDLEFDHFPMSLQFAIDNADKLVLPIVGFIDKPPEMNIGVIIPAIRLLWCLEKDFNSINSIMCASVILPDVSVYEKLLSYEIPVQKMIIDSLFFCANYLIECINALSTQKTNEKLIIRLKQLIEVRKLIAQHIRSVIDYIPPICQYHVPVSRPIFKKPVVESKKSSRGSKRKSDGTKVTDPVSQQLDLSVLPCTSTAPATEAMAQMATQANESTQLSNYNGYFRDLHCHAYKLLRMELKLNPTKVYKKKKMSDLIVCDVSWSYRPEDKPELGPSDILFLLQDYANKAELLLRERPPFLAKKPTSLIVETISPTSFLFGTVKLLPKICNNLDIASGYCKDLIEANDGIWDAPGLFPKESGDIKLVVCAILKILAEVLTWNGFQKKANKETLKEMLTILSRKSATGATQTMRSVALGAAQYLMDAGKVVPLISGAVQAARTVQACIHLSPDRKDLSLVEDLCESLLQRPWFTLNATPENGPLYNQQVDSLLRTYFISAEDKLATVQRVTEIAGDEISSLSAKDSRMPTYQALTKSNFPLLYRALCEALVTAVSEKLIEKKDDDEECIAVWCAVTKILIVLVEIAKVNPSRTILASLLKRSQSIIQQFLNKGLPIMESALRVKSEEVLTVLKSLQSVTRFLHTVCCQSKMTNDAVIAAHVPSIRSLCERLTLEVKGMLILNKIPLDCITIAVLKNRDIQGNDILTQTTMSTSDDESELPPEEEEESDPPDVEAEVTIGEEESSND